MYKFKCPESWYKHPVRVLLIGCGGTGSEMLDALHRIHICLKELGGYGLNVTVYDDDTVEPNNIGRQRFWKDDVGQNKAVVSVQRINYCSGLQWQAIPFRFKPEMLRQGDCDLIITAVDSGKLRYELGQEASLVKSEAIWMDAGVGSKDGQVICGHLGQPSQGQKIPNVYNLYGEQLLAKEKKQEQPAGCSSLAASLAAQGLFINKVASDIMGDMLFCLVRHGEVQYHGSFFSISPMVVRPLPVDPHQWLTFGYQAD
ncbi:PRTRC system ThiF family protein [Endozoicomonas sp. ALC066]|uniref:PRTRC system ThiF family protein n=1 Tax=Endozoicomonas sp. ALC066 TaxID=3403078 RepID=UPI003BB5EB5E